MENNVQFTCWNVSYAALKTNTDTHTHRLYDWNVQAGSTFVTMIDFSTGRTLVSHVCPWRETSPIQSLSLCHFHCLSLILLHSRLYCTPLFSASHSLSLSFEDNLSSFYINHGMKSLHNLCPHYVKHNVQ